MSIDVYEKIRMFSILKKIREQNKQNNKKENYLPILKAAKKFYRNPIPESVIQLFYDEPEKFFASYKILLSNTSLYDISRISIFMHYFNVLYTYENSKTYEKYFDIFFKEFAKYLSKKDYFSSETPIHKLIKLKNKKFVFAILGRLKAINALNEELLLIKDGNNKNCYDIMIDEIIYEKNKIIERNELY